MTIAALAVAASMLHSLHLRRAEEVELASILETHLVDRRPGSRQQLDREVDPQRRRLLAARALVGDVLDPSSWSAAETADLTQKELVDAASEKLEAARSLALEVVDQNAGSWRAQLFVGASRYLQWMLVRDDRVVRQADAWRLPLQEARKLAPTEQEPLLFETLAQIELWQMLSPEVRQATLRQLETALENPTAQERRLIAAWLRVAPRDHTVFDPIPDRRTALTTLRFGLGDLGRWNLVVDTRRRELEATKSELARDLARARRARDAGDVHLARAALLARGLPEPHPSLIPEFTQLLETLPPGPLDPAAAGALGSWLEWALELQLYGVELLPTSAARRLVGLVAPTLGDLEISRARVLFLELKDLRELAHDAIATPLELSPEQYEKRALLLLQIASSLHFQDAQTPEIETEVRQLLNESSPPPRHLTLARWLLGAPDPAVRWHAPLPDRTVGSFTVLREGEVLELPLHPSTGGSAVEIFWNQEPLGMFERFPSQQPLRLSVRARPGVHRLEIRSLGSGSVRAGEPSLLHSRN